MHLHPDLHQAGGQVLVFEMAHSVLAVSAVYNGMPSQEELSIGLKHSPSLKFSEEG